MAALPLCLASPAVASGTDSEHLFGLTEGSDIGTRGERELELESGLRDGKRDGTYRVFSQAAALKLTLTDSFRVAPLVAIDHHTIRGVPGFDDRNNWALSEFAFEMKYRALDRQTSPIGLTFVATPFWTPIDDMSGRRGNSYGANFGALADKELIQNRLFAAFNVFYSTAAGRDPATAAWEHESAIGASAALSGRISDRVFLGGEVRFEAAYEGMALNRYSGNALFVGPSLYAKLSETAWASLVWNAQVAGHASGDPGALDLVNFDRHLVKLRVGLQF